MNNTKIISVESRKGGVGKSTIALNMAVVLSEKNEYEVLVIDVDITGTSIEGFTKSAFWKDKFNPVKMGMKDLNLLDYYQNVFKYSCDSVKFVSNKENYHTKNCLIVEENKINFIQSELYTDDNEVSVMCDPRLLFDELHSFWLIQMLDGIYKAFNDWVKETGKKGVIILDNSPGYVGLGSAIHEWLTDLGPHRAKFLMVSSLDTQDIKSSLSSIKVINDLLTNKIKGARFYKKLLDNVNEGYKELSDTAQSFVIHKLLSENETELDYYINKNKTIDFPELKSYQAIVINKAPSVIKDRVQFYNYQKSLNNESLYKVFNSLSDDIDIVDIIGFDPNIQYQLVRDYIYDAETDKDVYPIRSRMTYIRSVLTNLKYNLISFNYTLYLNYYSELNNSFKVFRTDLNRLGYGQLASLINEKWYPEYPLVKLQNSLVDLGVLKNNNMRRFYNESPTYYYDNQREYSKIIDSVKSKKIFILKWKFISRLLCNYIFNFVLYDSKDNLSQIIEQQICEILNYQRKNRLLLL